MGTFFLLYPLLSEPDYYKNLILLKINEQSGLSFNYKESEPIFLPFPGIELTDVNVSKNSEEVIRVKKLIIQINFGIFIGRNLEIRKVILNTGNIELKREKDETFPILSKFFEPTNESNDDNSADKKETNDIHSPLEYDQIFGNFPRSIVLKNVNINFDDRLYNRNLALYIWDSRVDFDLYNQQIDLAYYGKLNEEIFQIYMNVSFLEGLITYENLRFEGSIHFDDFSGVNLYDISVIFPHLDLTEAKLDAEVPFYKRTDNVVAADFKNAHLINLARKGYRPFIDAYINVLISYDISTSKLAFDNISAEWKGKLKLFGNGFVTFVKPPELPTIMFEGGSEYVDADTVINIMRLFLDPDLSKSIFTRDMPDTHYIDRMNVYLNFNLKRANLRGIFADDLSFNLHYNKSLMKIKKLNVNLYNGKLNGTGGFYWGEQPKLSISGKSEGVSLDKLFTHQFGSSPITGTLETNYTLNAIGNTESSLVKTLKIHADFLSRDGELLSYTNILKPISSIGNLISLKKLDFNKSTPYKEIAVDMDYFERNFQFSDFILKADGLSAKGAGAIDLDKKINMKFTIALPGLAGNVLKLPIIYKGTYGINSPYIDPIWLGSIYAGTILLAGPAGATVGGIAGSAVSDYVDRAVDKVSESVQSGWSSMKGKFTQLFSSDSNLDEK